MPVCDPPCALMRAVRAGDAAAYPAAIAEALETHGRQGVDCIGPGYETPLEILAGRGDLAGVDLLLQAGANPRGRGQSRGLRWAVRGGHGAVARRLLDAGCDPLANDGYGNTAFSIACRDGAAALVEAFLERGIAADAQARGRYPLWEAAEAGRAEVVQLLLDGGADARTHRDGKSLLVCAAKWGDKRVVRHLLRAGAPVEDAHAWGTTALQNAAKRGHTGVLKVLLKAGADPEARAQGRQTPLMVAAREVRPGAVRLLLAAGACLEPRDIFGRTALQIATLYNSDECASLLRAHADAGRRVRRRVD